MRQLWRRLANDTRIVSVRALACETAGRPQGVTQTACLGGKLHAAMWAHHGSGSRLLCKPASSAAAAGRMPATVLPAVPPRQMRSGSCVGAPATLPVWRGLRPAAPPSRHLHVSGGTAAWRSRQWAACRGRPHSDSCMLAATSQLPVATGNAAAPAPLKPRDLIFGFPHQGGSLWPSRARLAALSDWQRSTARRACCAAVGSRSAGGGGSADRSDVAAAEQQQGGAEPTHGAFCGTAVKATDAREGEGGSPDGTDGTGGSAGGRTLAVDGTTRRQGSLQRRTASLRLAISAGGEDSHDAKEPGSHTLRGRVSQAFRGAFQTSYTVLFYNTVVRLLKVFGAGPFFSWITPRLEHGYATVAGVWHVSSDGRRRAFSLANNYDPAFDIPRQYCAQEFPFCKVDFEAPPSYEPRIAHLLSLTMKVVYEHNDVIQDLVERCWGLQCRAIIQTLPAVPSAADASSDASSDSSDAGGALDTVPGSEGARQTRHDVERGRQRSGSDGGSGHRGDSEPAAQEKKRGEASFLPSSKALIVRSQRATIVAFRGTEATNLLNWQTNITINMTRHKRLGGVHDGFYAALFHRPAEGGSTLFEDIVAELREIASDAEQGQCEEPLFITGHSLGGAIASVFAQALVVKEPELAASVAGIYTWGEPRVGDSAFRDAFERAYGDRCFRIRNAGDIVPFLLPQWLGYRHRGQELFFTTFGGMKSDPQEIRRAALRENLAFPLVYIYQVLAGRLGRQRETWLRTLYRLSFAFVAPGFASHFPSNYETAVRAQLKERAAPPAAGVLTGEASGQKRSGAETLQRREAVRSEP